MVRLKEAFAIASGKSNLCFNSNMVRLKDGQVNNTPSVGAFQFQYGTIKRREQNGWSLALDSFNSNMVRLKVLKEEIYNKYYV